jgi:hypothetical protein
MSVDNKSRIFSAEALGFSRMGKHAHALSSRPNVEMRKVFTTYGWVLGVASEKIQIRQGSLNYLSNCYRSGEVFSYSI